MNCVFDLSELDRMVGRLFLCGLPGPRLDRGTRELISRYEPGGFILFSRNVEDPVQVAELCRELQEFALETHGRALFLAVDQEGGRVARLKKPFTEFPGNEAIAGDAKPEKKAQEFARITAEEMRLVGLNMDMAPVLDVRQGPAEEHLRGRTFGEDPRLVARLGGIVIKTLQGRGVMAVAKHFPGLGRASRDPHKALPEISLSVDEMVSVDLSPFRSAVEAGVAGIMTSHAVYPSLDPDVPATMSGRVVGDLLRKKMAYDGLVITDDLEMGAIARTWGVPRGSAAAFAAGADLLLICEDQDLFAQSHALVRKKILAGELPLDSLHESLGRLARARSRFLKKPLPASIAAIEERLGKTA